MAASTTKETWKNSTKGRVWVQKFDRKGDLTTELIRSGGTVLVTPDERSLNQDMAANDDLDVFKNGSLTPVRLIDGTDDEDRAAIENNPNNRSEEELRDMFKLQWKKFESEVGGIANLSTLLRLKEIAQEGDATVKQVNVIETRIADVDPSVAVTDTTISNYGSVAPSGPSMGQR